VGDVWITTGNGVATGGKLTIDTRSKILQGTVHQYWGYKPSEIELIADQGIDMFYANYSPKISATSLYGAIHLGVERPGQLIINAFSPTAGDVFTGGFLGPDVNIYAGRDINLTSVYESGTLMLTAGRDVNFDVLDIVGIGVTAGRNIDFGTGDTRFATAWLNGGDLTATSTGGNIAFGSTTDYSAVHIGGGKNLTLNAYGSVELGILETLGAVGITAQTGNITLRNDIGPPVLYYNPDTNIYYSPYNATLDKSPPIYGNKNLNDPSFDPTGIGVASLLLSAGGNINMQGAKAAGTVNITAGGLLTPTKGIYSGTSNGVYISAIGGAWEKLSGGDVPHSGPYTFTGTSFGDIPLGAQAEMRRPVPSVPAISAGPAVDPPAMPMALTALPAQPPGVVNVSGSNIPAAPNEGPEQETDPTRIAGWSSLREVIPDEGEEAAEESGKKAEKATPDSSEKRRAIKIKADQGKDKIILDFAGGRGDSQTAVTTEILGTYISGPLNASSRRR
jgi:hypothetical protein